ncbi:MAG TPA: hypothetical protein PK747_01285 [Acidobacteriota bacterium]|nr:hypothetical protein [Acidobacteriota bacterium]HQQ46025.1 hypothetical protein [Acidobacteriota bacterium]
MLSILQALDFLFRAFLPKNRLRPYERKCLEAWSENLEVNIRDLLWKHIDMSLTIQRFSKDKLTCFFPICQAGNKVDPHLELFEHQGEEILVAIIYLFSQKRTGTTVRARIVIHKGRLSSIEYDEPPKLHFFVKGNSSVSVHKTEIITSLQEPSRQVKLSEDTTRLIYNWLGLREQTQHELTGDYALNDTRRECILSELRLSLPDDYLKLLKLCNGFCVDGIKVYGLGKMPIITTAQSTFWILVDFENRYRLGISGLDKDKHELLLFNDEGEISISPMSITQSIRNSLNLKNPNES